MIRRFARRFVRVFVLLVVASGFALIFLSPLILGVMVNPWLALTGFVSIPFSIALSLEFVEMLENKWGKYI